MKSIGIKNTVVFNGWKDNGFNKTKNREYDFLIICEPLHAVIHIESKTAFDSSALEEAAKSLKSGLDFFREKISFPESDNWSYVRVASFANMKEKIFYLREETRNAKQEKLYTPEEKSKLTDVKTDTTEEKENTIADMPSITDEKTDTTEEKANTIADMPSTTDEKTDTTEEKANTKADMPSTTDEKTDTTEEKTDTIADMPSTTDEKTDTTEEIFSTTEKKPLLTGEKANTLEDMPSTTENMSKMMPNTFNVCSKCQQFVIGSDWNFSTWWSELEALLSPQTNPEIIKTLPETEALLSPQTNPEITKTLPETEALLSIQINTKSTETYTDIVGFLHQQMLMQKDCVTDSDIAKDTQEKIERFATLESIFFWNNVPFSLLTETAKRRIVFTSNFGTGKTSCIRSKAGQLLREEKKVLIIFFQDGNTSRDSLLKKTYEIQFHDERFKVKSISGSCKCDLHCLQTFSK